jgi:hypothetical protein
MKAFLIYKLDSRANAAEASRRRDIPPPCPR